MVKRNFKRIIIEELATAQENNLFILVSKNKLLRSISEKYKIGYSERRLKNFITKGLRRLEEDNSLIRKKYSFRLRLKLVRKFSRSQNTKKDDKLMIGKKNARGNKNPTKTFRRKVVPKIHSSAKTPLLTIKSLTAKTSLKEDSLNYKKRWPAVWQYYDNNNLNAALKRQDGWYEYDAQASDIVEDEWQKYIVNRGMNDVRAVKSGEWEYMVDFINWRQTNIIHQNHKVRSIRRICEKGHVTKNPYQ